MAHYFGQLGRCVFCGAEEEAVRDGRASASCQQAGMSGPTTGRSSGGSGAVGGTIIGGGGLGTAGGGNISTGTPGTTYDPYARYHYPTSPAPAPAPAIQGQSLDLIVEDEAGQQEEKKESIDWEAHRRFMKGLDRT